MKRLGITLLITFLMTVSSVAMANQPATWKSDINSDKLGQFLALDSQQNEEVAKISDFFTQQMKKATQSKKANKNELIHNAVYGNLKLMKETLTSKQYNKYVTLINITLKNKGIELK